jgi:hypothetical protein
VEVQVNLPLGHIATIRKQRRKPKGVIENATYHLIYDGDNTFRIEKEVDSILEVTLVIKWDNTRRSYYHYDELCTAGTWGKRCHHIEMVEDTMADIVKLAKESEERES